MYANARGMFGWPEVTIVAINGAAISHEGSPDPGVIAVLEAALDRAMRGEVTSVAVAEVHANGATRQNWCAQHTISLLGEVARMQSRIAAYID